MNAMKRLLWQGSRTQEVLFQDSFTCKHAAIGLSECVGRDHEWEDDSLSRNFHTDTSASQIGGIFSVMVVRWKCGDCSLSKFRIS